jgi:two-component system, OmpR family, sensor histidine kinase KdpD
MSTLFGRRFGGVKAAAVRHPYVLAVLSIVVSTAVFLPARGHVVPEQWPLIYLLIVALIARVGGARPAILASVLAFFAWNFFFLPPYHTLAVADPQDWLDLGVFLVVGTVVGFQTGRLRDREARAVRRERESNLIAQLSAYLVSEVSSETMARTVVADVRRLIDASAVSLFVPDGGECRVLAGSPHDGPPPSQLIVRTVGRALDENVALNVPPSFASADVPAAQQEDRDGQAPAAGAIAGGSVLPVAPAACPPDCDRTSIYLPLRAGGMAQGVLVVGPRLDHGEYRPPQLRLMEAVANVVAAFMERQRLQEQAAMAEAAREADVLKSSLLSSVSHELKTPLAALTATVSNLLEGDTEWDEESVREELRSIVGDVARLNNSIGSLLDLSRLEAHAWIPHREWYEIEDIILAGLGALPVHQRNRVLLQLPADLPPILVDYVQISRVFQNLLENAVLYSGDEGSIDVGAVKVEDTLRVWVEDHGRGIRREDKDRVFEKFYRSKEAGVAMPSGTGLGLAIAREIVHAHGGRITVEDVRPHGARFVVELIASGDEGGDGHADGPGRLDRPVGADGHVPSEVATGHTGERG